MLELAGGWLYGFKSRRGRQIIPIVSRGTRKGSGKGSGFLLDCCYFWLLNVSPQQRVTIVADVLSVVLLNHGDAGSGLLGYPFLITAQG